MNNKKSVRDMAFKGYGIELRPVTPSDLPSLRRWRNSQQISRKMVEVSKIASHQQRLWYEGIRERFDQAHWVVWCKGVRTGYINIKGEGPTEIQEQLTGGMYTGNSRVRHGMLGYAMQFMLLDIVFEHLSVSEFRGPVRKDNFKVRQFLKNLGYREEGCKGDFVWTTICLSDYETAKKKFMRYFTDTECELLE